MTLISFLIIILPGTPTTVELDGTSFNTTEPAPILQLSPIVNEPRILAPAPIRNDIRVNNDLDQVHLPDPVMNDIDELKAENARLRLRVSKLENDRLK